MQHILTDREYTELTQPLDLTANDILSAQKVLVSITGEKSGHYGSRLTFNKAGKQITITLDKSVIEILYSQINEKS